MTYEETIKLVNAGYTKAEIESMERASAGTEGTKSDSNEQGASDQTHEGAVDANISEDIAKVFKPLQEEIKNLGSTVKALQEINLKNAQSESPNKGDSVKNTIDEFLKTL